jgi:predicted lipid carrier protein YhbT
MTQEPNEAAEARAALQNSLERLAQRLRESRSLRQGDIVFHLAGSAGGNYCFECSESQVRVAESATAGVDRQPLIEVIGNAETIQAIIDGKKDARKQFFAGGLRVRGDLRYLSDIALELGILKTPL